MDSLPQLVYVNSLEREHLHIKLGILKDELLALIIQQVLEPFERLGRPVHESILTFLGVISPTEYASTAWSAVPFLVRPTAVWVQAIGLSVNGDELTL
jgi:hypothetical protein